MDLVTLEAYKEYRGIRSTDKDGKRSLLISLASKLVQSYCARSFIGYVDTDKVEYFDARTPEVMLTEWPIIAVTHVKTSEDGGITQLTLTEDDAAGEGYFVDIENMKIFTQSEGVNFLSAVEHPFRSLEVSYTAGYTDENGLAEIPFDLKLAMFDIVAYYEDNEKTANKTISSSTIDNPLPVISSDFPAHIKRILDLYRVIDL